MPKQHMSVLEPEVSDAEQSLKSISEICVSNSSEDEVNSTIADLEWDNRSDAILLTEQLDNAFQMDSEGNWPQAYNEQETNSPDQHTHLHSYTPMQAANSNQCDTNSTEQHPISYRLSVPQCIHNSSVSICQPKPSQDSIVSANFYLGDDTQVQITCSETSTTCHLKQISFAVKSDEDSDSACYQSLVSSDSDKDLDGKYFSDNSTSFQSEPSPEFSSVQVSYEKPPTGPSNKSTEMCQEKHGRHKKISVYGNGDKVGQKHGKDLKKSQQTSFQKCVCWLEKNNFPLHKQAVESRGHSQNLSSKDKKYKSTFQHVSLPDTVRNCYNNSNVSQSYSEPTMFTDPAANALSKVCIITDQRDTLRGDASSLTPEAFQKWRKNNMKSAGFTKQFPELPTECAAPLPPAMNVLPNKDFYNLSSIQNDDVTEPETHYLEKKPSLQTVKSKMATFPSKRNTIHTPLSTANPTLPTTLSREQSSSLLSAAKMPVLCSTNKDDILDTTSEPGGFLKSSCQFSLHEADNRRTENPLQCDDDHILDIPNQPATYSFTAQEINDILSQYTDPALGLDGSMQNTIQVFMLQNSEAKGMYKTIQGRQWQHGMVVAALKKRFEEIRTKRGTENMKTGSQNTESPVNHEPENPETPAGISDDVTVIFSREIPKQSTSSLLKTARTHHLITHDNAPPDTEQHAATEDRHENTGLLEPTTQEPCLNADALSQTGNRTDAEVTSATAQDTTFNIHRPRSYIAENRENFIKAREALNRALVVKTFQGITPVNTLPQQNRVKQEMADTKLEAQEYETSIASPRETTLLETSLHPGEDKQDKLKQDPANEQALEKCATNVQETLCSTYQKLYLRTRDLANTTVQKRKGFGPTAAQDAKSQQEKEKATKNKHSMEQKHTHQYLPADDHRHHASCIYNKHSTKKACLLRALHTAKHANTRKVDALNQQNVEHDEKKENSDEYVQGMNQKMESGTDARYTEEDDMGQEFPGKDGAQHLLQQTENLPEEDKEVFKSPNYHKHFLRAKARAIRAFQGQTCSSSDTEILQQPAETVSNVHPEVMSQDVSGIKCEENLLNGSQRNVETRITAQSPEHLNIPADILEIYKTPNYHQQFLRAKARAIGAFQGKSCSSSETEIVQQPAETDANIYPKVTSQDVNKMKCEHNILHVSQMNAETNITDQPAAYLKPTEDTLELYSSPNYGKKFSEEKSPAATALQNTDSSLKPVQTVASQQSQEIGIAEKQTPEQSDISKVNQIQDGEEEGYVKETSPEKEVLEQIATDQVLAHIQVSKSPSYKKTVLRQKALAAGLIQKGRRADRKDVQDVTRQEIHHAVTSCQKPEKITKQQTLKTDSTECSKTSVKSSKTIKQKKTTQPQMSQYVSPENMAHSSRMPAVQAASNEKTEDIATRGPRSVSSMIRRWDRRICHPSKSTINFFASIQNLHHTPSTARLQTHTDHEHTFGRRNIHTQTSPIRQNSTNRIATHKFSCDTFPANKNSASNIKHSYSQNISACAKVQNVLDSVRSGSSTNLKDVIRSNATDMSPMSQVKDHTHHNAPSYASSASESNINTHLSAYMCKEVASANLNSHAEASSCKDNIATAGRPATIQHSQAEDNLAADKPVNTEDVILTDRRQPGLTTNPDNTPSTRQD